MITIWELHAVIKEFPKTLLTDEEMMMTPQMYWNNKRRKLKYQKMTKKEKEKDFKEFINFISPITLW